MKDRGDEATAKPSPSEQTPFDRFTEFARKVISVPKSELEERERQYQEKKAAERKKSSE
ncbi:MAG TPA: hypothetical protein VOA87_01695 [Thermoanaerobaculia bacterium]|nr:hypothetical protein [Thermoanaerobaculia bacterium]